MPVYANHAKELLFLKARKEGRIIVNRDGTVDTPDKKNIGRKDKDGYVVITLTINGATKNIRRGRLVYLVYIDKNLDPVLQINHKNGIKDDDCVENIESMTARDNILHAHRTGLADNRRAHDVTDDATAAKIRKVYSYGFDTYESVGKKFGVSAGVVGPIIKNEHYIDPNYDPSITADIRSGRSFVDEQEMYDMYISGNFTHAEIGKKFGVSTRITQRVINAFNAAKESFNTSFKPNDLATCKHNRKFTDDEVRYIFKLINTNRYTDKEIGAMVGVSRQTIGDLRLRNTYKYVDLSIEPPRTIDLVNLKKKMSATNIDRDKDDPLPACRKFTDDEIYDILDLYATGKYAHRKIGALYGVSCPTIGAILRGQSYAHLVSNYVPGSRKTTNSKLPEVLALFSMPIKQTTPVKSVTKTANVTKIESKSNRQVKPIKTAKSAKSSKNPGKVLKLKNLFG